MGSGGLGCLESLLSRRRLSWPLGREPLPDACGASCASESPQPSDAPKTMSVPVGAQPSAGSLPRPPAAWARNVIGGTGSSAEALFQVIREEQCRLVEAMPLPADLVAKVRSRLDALRAEDLGVSWHDAGRLTGFSGVGYQEVYSGPDLTLCIFVLRAGARIPLHDHPGMQVFGRLLFGRMRVISFDLESPCGTSGTDASDPITGDDPYSKQRSIMEEADPAINGIQRWPPGSLWATACGEQVFGPAPITYSLGPRNGNVHELAALEDCAFFDVVTPPYDPQKGRDCTYYEPQRLGKVYDGANELPAGCQCILVPCQPRRFSTEHLPYRGPRFLRAQC